MNKYILLNFYFWSETMLSKYIDLIILINQQFMEIWHLAKHWTFCIFIKRSGVCINRHKQYPMCKLGANKIWMKKSDKGFSFSFKLPVIDMQMKQT